MSKDRSTISVTTTADHLSRAVEAILKRFPRDARPDKNALLNDVAQAIRPGKNWGGLLVETADTQETIAPASCQVSPQALSTRMRAALRNVPSPDGDVPIIGATVRRLPSTDRIMSVSPILEGIKRGDTATSPDGSLIVGVSVQIYEDMQSYSSMPTPTIFLLKDGEITGRAFKPDEDDARIARMMMCVLQDIAQSELHSLLHMEGIRLGNLVLGPVLGAAIIPDAAEIALWEGQGVLPLSNAAVRIVLPEGATNSAETLKVLSPIIETALDVHSDRRPYGDRCGPVRLEIEERVEVKTTWLPLDDAIPTPQTGKVLVSKQGTEWLDSEDPDAPYADTLFYVLGEALAFILDYHGIPAEADVHIQATGRDSTAKSRGRVFCDDWRLLSWRDGMPGEWRLADSAEHEKLRAQLEAWVISEGAKFVSRADMPNGSPSIITPRWHHRNQNHWERACAIFEALS